ncbi:DUF5658 family protein [Tepidibacter mesophilus]|uniref:DUF5658 family protein n=1 Tax=Tepidibacter mesophilus TaxID=655607 RepID=UPI000C0835AF
MIHTIKRNLTELNKSIYTLFLLNLFDLTSTVYGLEKGYIEEANPIMNYFYTINVSLFILIKIFIVLTCLYIFHYNYEKVNWVKKAIWIPISAYIGVTFLHFYIFYMLITNNI